MIKRLYHRMALACQITSEEHAEFKERLFWAIVLKDHRSVRALTRGYRFRRRWPVVSMVVWLLILHGTRRAFPCR